MKQFGVTTQKPNRRKKTRDWRYTLMRLRIKRGSRAWFAAAICEKIATAANAVFQRNWVKFHIASAKIGGLRAQRVKLIQNKPNIATGIKTRRHLEGAPARMVAGKKRKLGPRNASFLKTAREYLSQNPMAKKSVVNRRVMRVHNLKRKLSEKSVGRIIAPAFEPEKDRQNV